MTSPTVRPVVTHRDSGILADFVRSMSPWIHVIFAFISNKSKNWHRACSPAMTHIDYDPWKWRLTWRSFIEMGKICLIGTARLSIILMNQELWVCRGYWGTEFQGLRLASYLCEQLFQVRRWQALGSWKHLSLRKTNTMLDFCRHLGFSMQTWWRWLRTNDVNHQTTPTLLEKNARHFPK